MKELQKSLETASGNISSENTVSTASASAQGASGDTNDISNTNKDDTTGEQRTEDVLTDENDTKRQQDRETGKKSGDQAEESSWQEEETKNGSQGDSEEYYIVERGDTLDNISRKLYGDTSGIDAICRMNGLSDGNLIYVGQKLLLP